MKIKLCFDAEMWTATDEAENILKTSTTYEAISRWARRKKYVVISIEGLDD